MAVELTPKQIVKELDKYIIGQNEAKKSVAIALRNRYRRLKLEENMRKEIMPKNILMIGPTGVGKTEIARRLAQIANAPFIKVEATRFTEVGYVGKNVESMIRELVDVSINMVRNEMMENVQDKAEKMVEEIILDSIMGVKKKKNMNAGNFMDLLNMFGQNQPRREEPEEPVDNFERREALRQKLRNGELEDIEIEIEVEEAPAPMFAGLGPEFEDMGIQIGEMFSNMMPKKIKRKKVKIRDARKLLLPLEAEKLIDKEKMIQEAIDRAQNRGIIFIDEMDKIAARSGGSGPDVSREGVQRDLLPIVEGTTVITKHGPIKTDYMLFIAAGAFHVAKPSDLIPEIQGRFPIRVELEALTEKDFIRILVEPENAITKQYKALLETDGVNLVFTEEGIEEIAKIAFDLNERIENIGARRLYTVVEKVLEEVSFEAPLETEVEIQITKEYVRQRIGELADNKDLSEFVL
ncbi:ATP-dependent protease [Marinitoga sp. 1135]|uniref:ATP-dependent protease ATPase subunit HslU n=1 Tax=Marinitoga piezophila (strain DSM 14283 / JCM 11233 / KA3) TaxID=443254 RepID=H2J636_MARPK|nr:MULTISPECIES: ATP-dependent protease ATPase subunit HslU [Marinitoga]AEX85097.1 ATP-dependent protease HslVU, ATPase subunit [Marinitoga piezophila KA3]NUU95311.1 ATP-dependent protease [Marinitoga sp. 1135]NUU97245.1 ATP-dependent protease [Marinitoga sp. 1138]